MTPAILILSLVIVGAVALAVRAVLVLRRREAQRSAALARLRPDE